MKNQLFLIAVLSIVQCTNVLCSQSDWVNHGGGILNQRDGGGAHERINASSVSKLALKWKFVTNFDVSVTPSIADGKIYFSGWNGNLYALEAENGGLIWEKNLTELTGIKTNLTLSRATPVIVGDVLLVGLYGPAVVIAVNRRNGDLIWQTDELDTAPATQITMSGTVYEGFYYVGVSSSQESFSCCSFRGSFQKIDVSTGRVVWRTFMLPADSGYYGAALWGSSPSIDKRRRLVYIATGNTYQVPEWVERCELQQANKSIRDFPEPCIIPANHEDSILALSIDTGSIVWSRQLGGYDVYLVNCSGPSKSPKCPQVLGPDYDFGEAPMLLEVNGSRCVVVTGQKSGVVWALDCDTGDIVWSKAAGPGGALGGASWGAATDTQRVYTAIGNYLNATFVLAPSQNVTKGGGWVAMNANTGAVLWSTANPSGYPAAGPVTVVNGVLFGASFADTGELYALDALTGNILWHYTTGARIYGGFSVAYGCVYGGNGYASAILGHPGKALYAFCLT